MINIVTTHHMIGFFKICSDQKFSVSLEYEMNDKRKVM